MSALGLDVSNYTGAVTAQQLTTLSNCAGMSRIIIGTQDASIFQQQYEAAAAAGYHIEAYVYLYNAQDWTAQVAAALALCSGKSIERLWLDIEDTTAPLPTEQQIRAALAQVSALPVGIYTGAWYWHEIGNPLVGDACPLWNAQWDGDTSNFTVQYGGWYQCLVKQYTADAAVVLSAYDLDAWRE